jgi:23S rRNA pseudouridine1911/1915/1917 synthase
MAAIGHPLVADEIYGGVAAAGMQRQALHAFRLSLTHPVTQQALVFFSELPQDLSDALTLWGLSYTHG